jgi:hypothetical protein
VNVDTDTFLALRGEVHGLGAAVEELARRQYEERGEVMRSMGRIEAILTGWPPARYPGRHAAPGRHLRLVKDAR